MNSKVLTRERLVKIREGLKEAGKRVVFTNGCFDLLHGGHIHLFREAKKRGDILIVGVNGDRSVRKLKGTPRPIFSLEERLEILEAIVFIDYLIPFSEKTPHKLIAVLVPDVLVKGGDWKPDQVVGRKVVKEAGGEVVVIPFKKGKSTSRLIAQILQK